MYHRVYSTFSGTATRTVHHPRTHVALYFASVELSLHGGVLYSLQRDSARDSNRQTVIALSTMVFSLRPLSVHFRGLSGKTLDANRAFARELARSFSAQMGKALWLVFPDDAEVRGLAELVTPSERFLLSVAKAPNRVFGSLCGCVLRRQLSQ